MINNYILYCRKSTESDERQERSIEDQVKDMKPVLSRNGGSLIEVVEESKSAKKPYNRSGFQKMLERLMDGSLKANIACYALNRLSRNPIDTGAIIHALDCGIVEEVVTLNKTYKNTPEDKWMMAVEFGSSKKFSDDLSIVVKRGMKSHAEEGGWNHRAPVGYKNIRTGTKAEIVADSTKAFLIQRLFDLYLNHNWTIKAIREWLIDNGLYSGKKFGCSASVVYKILRNPFYIGTVRTKFGLYKGTHDPILSKEVFEAVQAKLDGYKHNNFKNPHSIKDFQTFKGLVRCDCCRLLMTPYVKKGKYIYLGCTNKNCEQGTLTEELLDNQIEKALNRIDFTEKELEEAKEALPEIANNRAQTRAKLLEELGSQEEELLAKEERIKRFLISGALSEEDFLREKANVKTGKEKLKEERKRIEQDNEGFVREITNFLELAKKAPELYKVAEPDLKRELIQTVFLELKIRGKKLVYRFKPEFQILCDRKVYDGGR